MTGFYDVIGYEISAGSVNDTGGALTVSDLSMTFPVPAPEMSGEVALDVSMTMPDMTLISNGDGTVKVVMPDSYTMDVLIAPEGDESGTISLAVDQSGLEIVASGDPSEVTYDMSSPGVTISLLDINIPHEEELSEAMEATMTLNDYSGFYVLGSGDMPVLGMNLVAASGDLVVTGREPDGSGAFDMNVAFQSVEYVADMVYAATDKPGDFTAMMKAGAAGVGSLSHGGAEYTVDFKDSRDSFAMDGSSSSGLMEFEMGDGVMSYAIGNTGMELTVSGSEIPLPEVSLTAAKTLFGMTMPVLASDDAKDLGLSLRLEGLSVSDMIWGMIDPAAQLPRDPATLIIELAGKANWLVDIMDPEALMTADVEMPGALESMDINELKLSIAGAELTGSGGFTFDMADMDTFDGIPAPTGALDLQLDGSNALMDKLVAMGLLPEEQAMMGKMMMGMFAQPVGDDSLSSKIEIDGASGAISANGQRLQ
ncbi:hypothetical protein AIOL_004262 [Candidatus Rhodobacter oscarellae]|uniref:DUF2125 domain-containing protein n=2 Tax=Candidatus Rhodobacter oscarellae TaxID=1675527 RepID=A0A0J9E9H6_9RHOB|nr:hypothetical protein AIOL_004262 [Candidatus Rhodobacter lobularis]